VNSTVDDAVLAGADAPETAEALRQRRRAALILAVQAPDLLEPLGLKGYQGHDTERSGVVGRKRAVWREGVGSPMTWPEDWHRT
jgi:hypothetical protein